MVFTSYLLHAMLYEKHIYKFIKYSKKACLHKGLQSVNSRRKYYRFYLASHNIVNRNVLFKVQGNSNVLYHICTYTQGTIISCK